MKRCTTITCWTDYPLIQLGDTPGAKAPIRRVQVLDYDGNKYATVRVIGEPRPLLFGIKAGYLYSLPGRLGRVPNVRRRKLERGIYSRIDEENKIW